MEKEKLKQIISDLRQVILESELKVKDSELLDFAIRIYNSESIKQEINPNEKPTEKQLAIIKKDNPNVILPNDLTRNEASQIVSDIFKKQKNDKKEEVEY